MPEKPVTRADLWDAQGHVETTVRSGNRIRLGFLLGFLIGVVLVIGLAEHTRQQLLAGCQRSNARSLVTADIVDNLIAANKLRIKAATSPSERAANQSALDSYRENKAQLVALAGSNPEYAGAVTVDCESAYPPTPPISWFS